MLLVSKLIRSIICSVILVCTYRNINNVPIKSYIFFNLRGSLNSIVEAIDNISKSEIKQNISNEIQTFDEGVPNIVEESQTSEQVEEINELQELQDSSEKIEKHESEWKLHIPKINLLVHIQEGTTQEVMRTSIGHFENTPIFEGNVGLAAHNRGKSGFFENLKYLKEGDKIIYYTNLGKKEYLISKITKIKETDWSCLENTNKNKITLITCVQNQPLYRLCVQAEEIQN